MTLKAVERREVSGERILKLASSFLYVDLGTPAYDLLSELKEPYQQAIAVVDGSLAVQGVLLPRDLVEILGKPFGRDLLQRQTVEDIMRPAVVYPYDEYVQEIREHVGALMDASGYGHYLLVDELGRFCGHVSSQDILVHAMAQHRQDLEMAMRIQSRLVPPCLSVRKGSLSITCSSVMAQGVGGDYYQVREYAEGKWFFCLCDISGKGLSAAIITAVLAGYFYNADFDGPLEDLILNLNSIVLDTFKLEKYLTGFFARFDQATGELEYCDMGHSFFFAVEGASIQKIAEDSDNVPVGLVGNPVPVVRTLRLAPGAALIVLSDGIIEQENRQGEDFSVSEIGRQIHRCIASGEDLVLAKIRILEKFFSFKKDLPQHDDISMLLFHYL